MQAGCQKLDACLLQFAEFSEQQEQLTRWLHDVEQAMAAHAQLRATLQEKQAQLQVYTGGGGGGLGRCETGRRDVGCCL